MFLNIFKVTSCFEYASLKCLIFRKITDAPNSYLFLEKWESHVKLVRITGPNSDVGFASFESVVDVEPFYEPDKLLNVP